MARKAPTFLQRYGRTVVVQGVRHVGAILGQLRECYWCVHYAAI